MESERHSLMKRLQFPRLSESLPVIFERSFLTLATTLVANGLQSLKLGQSDQPPTC